MRTSWLIQRLQQPLRDKDGKAVVNPWHAFGCGLQNGGLSREGMGLLKDIFQFDYMGAAEFEFGAVPEALQEIAKNQRDLVAFELTVWTDPKDKQYDEDLFKGKVTGTVYVICHKDHRDEVSKRISEWALREPYGKLKETIGLMATLRTKPGTKRSRWLAEGWLELDNGFLFFTDKVMWEKCIALFQVVPPKKEEPEDSEAERMIQAELDRC